MARNWVLIIVIIIFFAGLIGGVVYYFYDDDFFNYNKVNGNNSSNNNTKIPINSIHLKLYDTETKELISANYVLKQGIQTIRQGTTKNTSYEIIPDLDYGNYTIYLYKNGNDSYYLEEHNLSLTVNNTKFEFGLYKKARVVLLNGYNFDDKTEVYLNIQQGKFRDPILCIAYQSNIDNPYFENLKRIDVPKSRKMKYDRCFKIIGDVISDYKTYVLKYDKATDIESSITITAIDKGFNDELKETYDDEDIEDVNFEILL